MRRSHMSGEVNSLCQYLPQIDSMTPFKGQLHKKDQHFIGTQNVVRAPKKSLCECGKWKVRYKTNSCFSFSHQILRFLHINLNSHYHVWKHCLTLGHIGFMHCIAQFGFCKIGIFQESCSTRDLPGECSNDIFPRRIMNAK